MGSPTSNTPRQTPLCPKRRPPRPRQPIFNVFRRGGLHFGRCANHRHDRTATTRGNGVIRSVTRRRHAGSQLLMLQNPHRSQPEVRRAASKTGAVPVGAKKFAQHAPSSGISAKKFAQHAMKRHFWVIFPALGELFRVSASSAPRRANFFAHEARHHGDIETNDTTAHPPQGTAETGVTSAPEKCTKNAHFAPAKAMAVSTPHRYKRAKAT